MSRKLLTKKNFPYLVLLFILIFASIYLVFVLLIRNNGTENGSVAVQETEVSTEKIYKDEFETNSAGSGIPNGQLSDKYPNITIRWRQESVVDGNDSCYIFDTSSQQVYASKYKTSGFNAEHSVESGSKYYPNTIISEADALQLMQTWCYKEN